MFASNPQRDSRSLHARVPSIAALTTVVALSATASAFAAAPSAQAALKPKLRSISIASALPSAKHCLSRPELTIRLPRLRHVSWTGATVTVNGSRVRTIKRSEVATPVSLTGLPTGTIVVSIAAKTTDGRRATTTQTYRTCTPKPVIAPDPVPVPKPVPPDPTPTTPTPDPQPPAATSPSAGSYSGSTSQNWNIGFYVSADAKHLQDVTIPTASIGCAPQKSFYDHLAIADVAIAADGSFSATTKQDGVLFGVPAKFTYTFSGHVQGAGMAGAFREDISFDDGTAFSCTSGNQTWSTKRDAQGSQTASPPSAGSYSGSTSQNWNVGFYVSADGKHLQDVTIPTASIGCAPQKSFYDHLAIADVAIAADGSFSATTKQDGVLFGVPAKFTYTFSGHVHGQTSAGITRMAGAFREDITYDDGTTHSCTTNDQTWSTTRNAQGPQAAPSPTPGSYSGSTSQNWNVAFSVSADAKHLQDVTIPTAALGCAPARSFYDHLSFTDVTIEADGSFSATATQTGVASGVPAQYTYRFSGHVHGPTAAGATRIAGAFREDITYNNGTAYSCTTNDQTWSANHA